MKPVKQGVYELRTKEGKKLTETFSAVDNPAADVLIREIAKRSGVILKPIARYKLSSGDLDKCKWIQLEL